MKHGYQPKNTNGQVTPPTTGSTIQKPIIVLRTKKVAVIEGRRPGDTKMTPTVVTEIEVGKEQ